ncbi:hypothetical protein [Phascolarctobacterium faecium]|uniref:hypothetical protein n=2 Tax=Phascolarctobacterium faecium TaxID=33025 RepID=UPI00210CAEC1|nr:hypothetical protein [Phascolarctobacterium faecium]MCQ5183922.1 hypothetical protein [Phascolarctobacterium faecium]
MDDLLITELKQLQKEYGDILLDATKHIFQKDTNAILDEINVFWHRKKKLVGCVLENLSKPYDTYLFTAATILDISDYEHYPFLCLGGYHIWDDPIYGYIKMVTASPNEQFNEQIKAQIFNTIHDNIQILNSLDGKILILPVRMLSGTEPSLIHEAAMQAFLSLFRENLTFEMYREMYSTIDDIVFNLKDGMEKYVILGDMDSGIALKERFSRYKKSAELPLQADSSDATIFWFSVYGFLAQVFDILLTCIQYQLVPYIRYSVAFKYLIIISGNFKDNDEISEMIFKSVIAHILHQTFDKEIYSQFTIDQLIESVKSYNFEQQLFSTLKSEGITLELPALQKTAEIIDQQLRLCFSGKLSS